jgi:hypothetical protein
MPNNREDTRTRCILNVGGNSKEIPIPDHYKAWRHLLLDIDPTNSPDIVCDARKLDTLDLNNIDAVYCSHNLEHYYRHEVHQVLTGFHHILKNDGFCEIVVPDIHEVMRLTLQKNLDIDDVLYQSPAGPILVRDVIYGWGKKIEQSGNDFFAHKTGFTQKALLKALNDSGFPVVYAGTGNLEVRALAFKQLPSPFHQELLGISPPPQ